MCWWRKRLAALVLLVAASPLANADTVMVKYRGPVDTSHFQCESISCSSLVNGGRKDRNKSRYSSSVDFQVLNNACVRSSHLVPLNASFSKKKRRKASSVGISWIIEHIGRSIRFGHRHLALGGNSSMAF
jgi:hypothetical protein